MSQTPTIGALWRGWRDVLARLGFESAALDAKLLTGHGLGLTTLELATRENEPVELAAAGNVATLLQRRMTGESVARIIGEREFYGLAFSVNAATLEPRPETELLVDLALARLPNGGRMLDLGTGTGCVPIAVLVERHHTTAVAVDLEPQALVMAQYNAARHGVSERLALLEGSWFEPVQAERFALIASNPPYIASAVVETLAAEVREFDPRLSLDGGPDGLAPYRVIADQAQSHLESGGQLLVEIGFDQGRVVAGLFAGADFVDVTVHKDLNGHDRVVSARQR